jgi:hypothetical protein
LQLIKLFMKTTFIVIAAYMTSVAAAVEQMGFVFEVVRHGARAPLSPQFAASFPVPEGMLTP